MPGVVAVDTGLKVQTVDLGHGNYAVRVGSSGISPMPLTDAYVFLDGIEIGAREARRLKP